MATTSKTRIFAKLVAGAYKPDVGRTVTIKTDAATPVLIATATESPAASGQYKATWNEIAAYGYWYLDGVQKSDFGKIWLGHEAGSINLSAPATEYVSGSLGIRTSTPTDPLDVEGTSRFNGDMRVTGSIRTNAGTGYGYFGGRLHGQAGIYATPDPTTLGLDITQSWFGAKWTAPTNTGLALHGAPSQSGNYIQITSAANVVGDMMTFSSDGTLNLPSGSVQAPFFRFQTGTYLYSTGAGNVSILNSAGGNLVLGASVFGSRPSHITIDDQASSAPAQALMIHGGSTLSVGDAAGALHLFGGDGTPSFVGGASVFIYGGNGTSRGRVLLNISGSVDSPLGRTGIGTTYDDSVTQFTVSKTAAIVAFGDASSLDFVETNSGDGFRLVYDGSAEFAIAAHSSPSTKLLTADLNTNEISTLASLNTGVQNYAQCWVDNGGFLTAAFDVTLTTANVHYPVTSAAVTGSLVAGTCTTSTGSIVIGKSGTYDISYSISAYQSVVGGEHYHFHVHRNGVLLHSTEIEQIFANSTDIQTFGRSALAVLNQGDVLTIYTHTDSNTRTMHIAHFQFKANRLIG